MSKDQKQVEVKRDTKSLILKNLIVMAVLVAIALTGVVSWFTSRTKATADGINVTCETPDGLEIAVVQHGDPVPKDEDYKTGTITLDKKHFGFLENQSIEEITSDGVDFYRPKLTQKNGKALVDTSSKWDKASVDTYLSLDVYMRSKGSHTVTLKPDTAITPNTDTLLGDSVERKSSAGNFSKDCIIGAVRMSTVSDNKLGFVWIPAPNIQFFETKNEDGTTTSNVKTNVTSGDTYKHEYWEVDSTTDLPNEDVQTLASNKLVTRTTGDYKLGTNANGSKYEFAKLSKVGDSAYCTAMTTLNIWVDGEDSEARLALVDGQFTATIKLSI